MKFLIDCAQFMPVVWMKDNQKLWKHEMKDGLLL